MSKIARNKNRLLYENSFLEDTSSLIDVISKSSSSISNKHVKLTAKNWVRAYYDILEFFDSTSKGYKAFISLGNSVNNIRLRKLEWLKNLRVILKQYENSQFQKDGKKKNNKKNNNDNFVSLVRLKNLKEIKNQEFDLSRLLKMCEELNDCFSNEAFIASIGLVRAILDHVPPIFGARNFAEAANSRERSIKESLLHLENSSRKIADSYLHIQIRKRETLPTSNQVNFSQSLDVLLGEIYRILK